MTTVWISSVERRMAGLSLEGTVDLISFAPPDEPATSGQSDRLSGPHSANPWGTPHREFRFPALCEQFNHSAPTVCGPSVELVRVKSREAARWRAPPAGAPRASGWTGRSGVWVGAAGRSSAASAPSDALRGLARGAVRCSGRDDASQRLRAAQEVETVADLASPPGPPRSVTADR